MPALGAQYLASMKEPPSREKLYRWLGQLRLEVQTLFLYRKLWRQFIGTAESAGVPRSFMFTFLAEAYATRQAMVIRRVCTGQRGQYSFRHLLTAIRDHPASTRNRTDPHDVEKDLRGLEAGNLWRVRKYVDQYIAHNQESPVAKLATFDDIDAAIDQLGMLLRKYLVLVEGEDQSMDTTVAGDVMAPFRMAWLPTLSERPRPGRPQL